MRPVITTKPFQSTSQQRWAFGTGQPFAKRWAKQTNFKRLPYKKVKKDIVGTVSTAVSPTGPGGLMSAPGMGGTLRKRKKALTIAQLEAFVCSPHYDPATADAIAARIPEIPSLKGEQIAPGITRIHGNLCNVHGRYGKCPGAAPTPVKLSKPKRGRKPRKGAKPRLTPAQRASALAAQHAKNRAATLTSAGYSPADQAALGALRDGKQPTGVSADLISKGLVERATDGSYRMTSSGRALMHAADQGDAGRVRDTVSSATDRTTARAQRQQAAAQRTAASTARHEAATARQQAAQTKRAAAQAARAKRQAHAKPHKAGSAGGKTPAAQTKRPPTVPTAQHHSRPVGSGSSPSVTSGGAPKAPKPPAPAKVVAPKPTLAPALQTAAQTLSDGKTLTDADSMALIRNGLAHIVKGELVLTAAGRSATMKTFRVFKDARGHDRWVAQSSTAYQDRDQEIVSTKALTDDCAYADSAGVYGPLRWWHTPGLDLGDCDFNAMHGKVLIESGTFRSPAIAQKVAAAADALEISLGFLHLPSEPDASGVFHHIRKFERSLVPRGKASNRFTAFRVKERPMFDPTKVAALKQLGFSDADITGLQAQAEATEKAADEERIAFKADEPEATELPDIIVNGVTYKAFPPKAAAASAAPAEGTPEEEAAESPADEAAEMAAGEAPDADDTGDGLTLSPEDISAIGQAVSDALTTALGPLVSTMDLTNKIGGHMDELKSMMGSYQTKKDASDAEKAEQITALKATIEGTQAKLNELLGLQPEVAPRATATPATALNPFNPADNALLQSVKDQVPQEFQQHTNGFEDLAKNLFGR